MERVILFGVKTDKENGSAFASSMEELSRLAETAGVFALSTVTQTKERPDPAYFAGRGKLEELKKTAESIGASAIIFDNILKPAQQKNLEELLGLKVVDRSRLILDIFARRARSAEGKLQVELAQMNYFLPRITERFGTFEQQTGGIGTRGPGEKKLEVDRRRIMERIARLKKEIAALASRRHTLRKSRSRSAVAAVALAGYTNAGKSTLLNRLTRVKTVYTDDKLFATLDPVSRAGVLPGGRAVVFTDTVGFIQNLPHELIDAFKSTLEEIKESLVVIHLIDVSSEYWRRQRDVAAETISSLNPAARIIEVYNKADLLPPAHAQSFRRDGKMLVSAKTGDGIGEMLAAVTKYVEPKMRKAEIFIPYSSSGRLTEIHDLSIITRRRYTDEGVELSIEVPPANLSKIKDIESLAARNIKIISDGSVAPSPRAARRKK